MHFAKKNEYTIPLFFNAKILPLDFLYYKPLFKLMHDVSTASAPVNISNLLTKRPVSILTTHVLLLQKIKA